MGFMNKVFFVIGHAVAKRPILTILSSLVFVVVGSLGFINLTLEVDIIGLTPVGRSATLGAQGLASQ